MSEDRFPSYWNEQAEHILMKNFNQLLKLCGFFPSPFPLLHPSSVLAMIEEYALPMRDKLETIETENEANDVIRNFFTSTTLNFEIKLDDLQKAKICVRNMIKCYDLLMEN